MSNLVGRVFLNRFRVDAYLGSGGMGVVYRVWDIQRNVPLAMKVLHADLADDPTAFKRVQREAQALQELAHPNIVPFYGMFQADGFTFLIEQYVDGPTLEATLRQQHNQPMQPYQTLIYLKALCAALGYAHNRGFVHCDVKPGNVMIDRGGNIFLTDFGIARHAHSTTTTMGAVGTPAYMAPEQIMGKPVVPATDIYALGVVLFKLATGHRPYTVMSPGSDSQSQTPPEGPAYAHLIQPVPNPLDINPNLAPAFANVIMTTMAKEPGARYQSTMELLDAACASVGLTPAQIPTRVSLPDSEVGTVQIAPAVAAAAIGGIAGTVRADQVVSGMGNAMPPPAAVEMGTMRIPQSQLEENGYSVGQSGDAAMAPTSQARIPSWIWAVGGAAIVLLLCGALMLFMSLPQMRSLLTQAEATATLTATSSSTGGQGIIDPSNTPVPTQTSQPTFTSQPTYTPLPTYTPPPPPTNPPPPTQPPQPTNTQPSLGPIVVRIRNKTGGDVNLYRIGTSGETHYLGWLVHGYYGEYPFPSMGQWMIQYCKRDEAGNSSGCKEKSINVTDTGQEFVVP